jgi:hypothetical protein
MESNYVLDSLLFSVSKESEAIISWARAISASLSRITKLLLGKVNVKSVVRARRGIRRCRKIKVHSSFALLSQLATPQARSVRERINRARVLRNNRLRVYTMFHTAERKKANKKVEFE